MRIVATGMSLLHLTIGRFNETFSNKVRIYIKITLELFLTNDVVKVSRNFFAWNG